MSAFEAAATEVKNFKTRPNNDELLALYGLYKQAREGDNNTAQPWSIQMEATAKWNAWTKNKGMSKEEAEKNYVALVENLKPKYTETKS